MRLSAQYALAQLLLHGAAPILPGCGRISAGVPRDHRTLTVRPGHIASEVAFVLRFIWLHPANRGRRLRKLAEAARFQLKGRVLRRPSIARIGERSRIWVPRHVYSASRALYANPPDWPEMLVWRQVLRPGDLFVDVGANVGIYTIFAVEAGAQVIAVEPNRVAAGLLRENLALNSYQAQVLEAALADGPGTLWMTTDLGMGNHLVLERPSVPGSGLEEIPVLTLDDLVGDRTAAGVKIDVEGAESLVLAGARKALSERRIGLVQIEWTDASLRLMGEDRHPIAEQLWSFGYELCRPDDAGRLHPTSETGFGHDVFARPAG